MYLIRIHRIKICGTGTHEDTHNGRLFDCLSARALTHNKAQGNNRSKGLHLYRILYRLACCQCASMCIFGMGIKELKNIHVPDALDDVVNTETEIITLSPLRLSAHFFITIVIIIFWFDVVWAWIQELAPNKRYVILNAETLKCTFIFNRPYCNQLDTHAHITKREKW